MKLKDRIYDTLKHLVAIPSISGTEKENLIAQHVYDLLSDMPYFKENKDNFGMEDIDQDPLGRKFVWGIVNGKEYSRDTIILTGHIDVVGIEEFGHLKPVAYDIEECTKRINELTLDDEALKDLESGKWAFGRGVADMKAGIATDLELIREYSENRDFKGSLLFLAVPGEESNSEGMTGSVPFLLELQEKKEYNFIGAIVSECCMPKNKDDEFKRLYIGSVGKIMPLFFCVGKETHVGEPLKGLNPNALVSEISRLLEFNPDFCDRINGCVTPPPMSLKQADLKKLYSVQSPLFAVSYYNILTLDKSVEELLMDLKKLANKAFNNVLDDFKEKREKYMGKCCGEVQHVEINPCVMTYKELLSEVKEKYGDFANFIKEKIELWKKEKMDNQTIGINIVKETYERYENKRPMIIVSFIPPYYPHRHLNITGEKNKEFIEAIDKTIEYAYKKFNKKILKEDFFMGICDLSYTGIDNIESLDNLSTNIVGYGMNYKLPLESLSKLDIPGIVFGGEGKNFHKYTERLNLPYSLEIVPELYKYMIDFILKK